jgi:hypothetical protein
MNGDCIQTSSSWLKAMHPYKAIAFEYNTGEYGFPTWHIHNHTPSGDWANGEMYVINKIERPRP